MLTEFQIDKRFSALGNQDGANIGFDCRHEEFWHISARRDISDNVCSRILATRNGW
jgi:hypothetical protein